MGQKMKIQKIYILHWGNGMVGYFDETFNQVLNTSEGNRDDDLDYIRSLKGCTDLDITYLHSHDELNEYRRINGFSQKWVLK